MKCAVSQQILVLLQKVDEEEEEDRPPPQMVEQDSDKLANVIAEKLTPEMATELVLIGLMELPNSIPPHFNSAYTPIAAAGCYLLSWLPQVLSVVMVTSCIICCHGYHQCYLLSWLPHVLSVVMVTT